MPHDPGLAWTDQFAALQEPATFRPAVLTRYEPIPDTATVVTPSRHSLLFMALKFLAIVVMIAAAVGVARADGIVAFAAFGRR